MIVLPVLGQLQSGRNLWHNVTHWEWTPEHIGDTFFNAVGLVPFVGGFKVIGKVNKLAKLTSGVNLVSDVANSSKKLLAASRNMANHSQIINPKDIKFMQSSIKNQTGKYTVLGNAEALKNKTLSVNDLPNIRVWKDKKGQIWTLDHRRLAAFRLAELDNIPVQWAESHEVINQMHKMTTKTSGTSIRLKIGDGNSLIVR